MTKAELIERIVDAMVDPWTDNPEDYLDAEPTDLEYAHVMLRDLRDNEDAADLEPDERLPEDVTPELVMEAYNCLIRAKKHEAMIEKITDYFDDHPEFLAYCYARLANSNLKCSGPDDICPMDHFTDCLAAEIFFFDTHDRMFSKEEILKILGTSLNSIDMSDEYICFYNNGTVPKLVSTDDPTDVIEVNDFATCIVNDREAFNLFINEMLEDDDMVEEVFGCKKEDIINEHV